MNSRIQKSLMNAKVNVMFYVISVVLAFFSRKYFLDNLGTEFVGLSGTLGDMLNLMNITELGIGTAVGVTLYKPIFDQDREKICDIISVFGFLYTRVGGVIALAGIVLSCFFPMMFAKAGVPLYLAYLMFYAMLYASLLGYFVNYRQIILSASQQNYVIMLRYNTAITLKVILQIFTSFLPYNYLWWIALEALTITVYTFILNGTIRKYYPWLQTSYQRGKEKFREYKDLWTKTKQVFVLKISYIVFNSATSVLTASFVSLSMVAYYGNYNMLMSKVTSFISGIFTGMEASIGNLIAEDNKSKIITVFFELLSFRYFMAGFCSITLYFTISPIISVWLGQQYILSHIIVVFLSLHILISQARSIVVNFKNGYGIYKDIWAPVSKVVIFLLIAITFAIKYGLVGILVGMLVSETLIEVFWNPYYLFKKGFKVSVWRIYWPVVLKYYSIFIICFYINTKISTMCLSVLPDMEWISALLYCITMALSVLCVQTILFLVLDSHIMRFVQHLLEFKNK